VYPLIQVTKEKSKNPNKVLSKKMNGQN